jgi:phenylacetate-coenzyme A ligase PaaK-like adenylate-forming protein
MHIKPFQMALIRNQLRHAAHSPFYATKFIRCGVDVDQIKSQTDFENLPFSDKDELRGVYPLGRRLLRNAMLCAFIHLPGRLEGRHLPLYPAGTGRLVVMMHRVLK